MIFSASCSSMIPCLPSMAAWAMEPAMSSLYIRASKAMEELKSLTWVSVSFWNRPAQSFIAIAPVLDSGRPTAARCISLAEFPPQAEKIRNCAEQDMRLRSTPIPAAAAAAATRAGAGEGGIAGIVPPTRAAR